jgi:hypothetical protein
MLLTGNVPVPIPRLEDVPENLEIINLSELYEGNLCTGCVMEEGYNCVIPNIPCHNDKLEWQYSRRNL